MPELWDCFMFNDEIDMLRFRLEELDPVVDRFVIVESDLTHLGVRKPLFLQENLHLFSEFTHKMDIVNAQLSEDAPSAWQRDNEQRAFMRKHIESGHPDDLLVIGDVDEIPRPELLQHLVTNLQAPVRLGIQNNMYFANWAMKTEWLFGPIACRRSQTDAPMLEELLYQIAPDPNRLKASEPTISGAGHHFYNIGGVDRLRFKLNSFTPHQEFNTSGNQHPGHLERCIELGVHFTGTDVLRRLSRAELDPMLERLYARHPDWFNFEPTPSKWKVRTWAGYTWLRASSSMPKSLVSFLDDRPWMISGPVGPVVLAADTARRAWGKLNRRRTSKNSEYVDI